MEELSLTTISYDYWHSTFLLIVLIQSQIYTQLTFTAVNSLTSTNIIEPTCPKIIS